MAGMSATSPCASQMFLGCGVVPTVVNAHQPDSLRSSSHVNSVSERVGSLGVSRYLQTSSVPLISLTDTAEFVLN